LVDYIGTSEANFGRNGIGMVKTVPTDGNSNFGDGGSDDFLPADWARMAEPVVMYKDIFKNVFL
jgi:hypothetical protein